MNSLNHKPLPVPPPGRLLYPDLKPWYKDGVIWVFVAAAVTVGALAGYSVYQDYLPQPRCTQYEDVMVPCHREICVQASWEVNGTRCDQWIDADDQLCPAEACVERVTP